MSAEIEKKLRAAEAYTARGWHVFVVTAEKRPMGNCARCAVDQHDPGACECLMCHAFYAGTRDMNRVRAMLWTVGGGGMLAVRTGSVSGLFAIDGEGDDKDEFGSTGVEVLDDWESWAGEEGGLGDALVARTAGGGLHLLYEMPGDAGGIGSRNRILPNVDVKGNGGYVVVGPGGGRSWLNWGSRGGKLGVAGPGLLKFLREAVGSGGRGGGLAGRGSVLGALRTADVIPAGKRYEFTRDLTYHLARNRLQLGITREQARGICHEYWLRYEQPPGWRDGVRRVGGLWFLPFSQMEYELTRAWSRVSPEEPVSFQLMEWARGLGSGVGGEVA